MQLKQETKEVMTLREAADYLRVSERSLWKLCKQPAPAAPPFFKLGVQYRFHRDTLIQWTQSQRQPQE